MFKDYHDRHGCIFIHVPKVAGTSIERVIFETDKWLVGHVKALDYIQKDKAKFENYFSFAFVRNPFDRMISAFHYLKKGGGSKEDTAWINSYFKNYQNDTFENFILALEDENIKQQMLSWQHFTPQYKFVCDENKNILVTFIGKFENINKDFKKILNLLNKNGELIHANKSHHLNYKNYYNPTTYNIVKNIYKEDFEIFDYDLEEPRFFFKNIQQNTLTQIKNKIDLKNKFLENLRFNNLNTIQNFNQIIKSKDDLIQNKNKEISNLIQNIQNKDEQIQTLNQNIQNKEQILSYLFFYGSAKQRVRNRLAYKLGQTLIINSKSILACLSLPFILLSLMISYKQEQKAYKIKIKKNPYSVLPPLESYPDYDEALKEKECFTYKLGEAFIKASKKWYKGGYFKFIFKDIPRLRKEFRKRK